MPRTRRTAEVMFPLIERYLASRLTQHAFAAEHDLPRSVFTYWLRKYRRQLSDPEVFQEISPVAEAAEQPLLEIRYPDGLRLCVFALLPPDYLAAVLGARLR